MSLRVVIVLLVLFFVAGIGLVLATDYVNWRGIFPSQTTPSANLPSGGTAANSPEPEPPANEVKRTNYDDWLLLCASPGGQRSCALVQRHVLGESKRFVFGVTMRSQGENEWEAAFTTPTNILLEPGLTIKSDEEQLLAIPFTQCGQQQCTATVEIERTVLEKLLKAGKLTASYQTATGQAFTVNISTHGLPQALAALRG